MRGTLERHNQLKFFPLGINVAYSYFWFVFSLYSYVHIVFRSKKSQNGNPYDGSRMVIPNNCSLWCEIISIRILIRNNTYNERNHWLHHDIFFFILILVFVSRMLDSWNFNPTKNCSWNYYRKYSDHISKYHPNVYCYTIVCSVISMDKVVVDLVITIKAITSIISVCGS